MASFQSAAETPDRDDEEEHPDVDCGHCGAYLGTHPCDEYVDCGECGGATLSRWAPEAADPSDEDIARRDAAWSEATLREHAESARIGEADAAIDRILMARGAGRTVPMVRADRLAAAEGECERLRAALDGRVPCTEQALDAIEAMSRRAVARESALRAELAAALAVVTAVRYEHTTRAAWADAPTLETLRAVRAAEAATRAALDGVPFDAVLVVDALRAENARLRAIGEGRTTAPTDAEMDAPAKVGGM